MYMFQSITKLWDAFHSKHLTRHYIQLKLDKNLHLYLSDTTLGSVNL